MRRAARWPYRGPPGSTRRLDIHSIEMNALWDGWVSPGNTHARATVEAKLAAPGYKVQIMVVAAR